MNLNPTTDRCFDCGGLWKKSQHEIWCPHHRDPGLAPPQPGSQPPDALMIDGPMRYGYGIGEMRTVWFEPLPTGTGWVKELPPT